MAKQAAQPDPALVEYQKQITALQAQVAELTQKLNTPPAPAKIVEQPEVSVQPQPQPVPVETFSWKLVLPEKSVAIKVVTSSDDHKKHEKATEGRWTGFIEFINATEGPCRIQITWSGGEQDCWRELFVSKKSPSIRLLDQKEVR